MFRLKWVIALLTVWPAVAGGQDATTRPSGAVKPISLQTLGELQPQIARPKHVSPKALPPGARDLLAEGRKRLSAGDASGAIDVLERAVGYAPADAQLRRELARAYLAVKNRGKARLNLLQAVRSSPDDVASLALLGRVAAADGDHADAIRYLRTVLACPDATGKNPSASEALLVLAAELSGAGYYTAADECYRKLGKHLSTFGAEYGQHKELMQLVVRSELLLARRGRLQALLGNHAEAADLFARAYARDRSNVGTARSMIESMLSAGKFDQAEKALVAMMREPLQRRQATILVERLCTIVRKPELIARVWKAYDATRGSDVGIALALATSADRIGAHAQAVEIARGALKRSPNNVAAMRALVRAMVALKQSDKVLEMLAERLMSDARSAVVVRNAVSEMPAMKIAPELDRVWARAAMKNRSKRKHALHCVAGYLAEANERRLLAIDQFRRAIDANREFLPAYESLIAVYLAETEHDKAVRLLERVRASLGESAFYHRSRGRVLQAKGDRDEALEALRKALAIDPDDVETLTLVAGAYHALGQTQQAERHYHRAITLEPDNVAMYRKLFDLHMDSQTDRTLTQARSLVSRLRQRLPASVDGRLMAIEVELALAGSNPVRRKLALDELAQLRRQAPGNIDVALLDLSTRIGKGTDPLADDTFNRLAAQLGEVLRRQSGNVTARRMLGDLMLRQKKTADAMAIWEQLYRDQPNDDRIAERFVRVANRVERYDLARLALERMIARGHEVRWARMVLVRVLIQLKDYPTATTEARRLLTVTKNPEVKRFCRSNLLAIYRKTGQYPQAHRLLDQWQAEGVDRGTYGAIHQDRIDLYCQAKQFREAISAAQKWRENSETPDTVRAVLILALSRHEAWNIIHKLIDEWLQEGSLESPRVFKSLKVSAYVGAKDLDAALTYTDAWLKETPWLVPPREMLIDFLLDQDQHDRAIKVLQRWLAGLTTSAGETKPSPGQRRTVIRWHRKMIVRTLYLQGKPAQAVERGKAYLKLDASDAGLMSIVASCLEESGQDAQAIALLEKTLQIEPTDPLYHNNLGYMLADRGLQLDRAEKLIRRALALEREISGGRSVATVDSLAWVLYKRGKFTEASSTISLALRSVRPGRGDHPVIRDHAGDIYYRRGRIEAAIEQWQKALAGAQATEDKSRELKLILKTVPEKLATAKAGKPVKTAPLGKGVVPEQPTGPDTPDLRDEDEEF